MADLTGSPRPDGSRELVRSGDGSRLFWQGQVYDPTLTEVGVLAGPIHAATRQGQAAIGSNQVFSTANGSVIATLPISSAVHSVSADDARLFSFDPAQRRIVVTPLDLAALAASSAEAPRFALEGISPNPMVAAHSRIRFAVASSDPVQLELVDVQGRRVWHHQLASPEPGPQSVPFEVSALGGGVYFLRMQQGPRTAGKRVVITR